jgi:hypothetical protein
LEIIEQAIIAAGGSIKDVTRTRIMLIDIANWKDAARACAPGGKRSRFTPYWVSRQIGPSIRAILGDHY